MQPASYLLLHHNFSRGTLDALFQERVNHWYDQLNKNPEIKYTLPATQIAESRFYYENNSSFVNMDKKDVTTPVSPTTVHMTRLDSTNKLSRPMRIAFVNFDPFVANETTYYNSDINGASIAPRTIFYTGADASTKFYRTYNVKTNLLNLDINDLRHIVTPTVGYSYNPKPSITPNHLKQIDSIDSITSSNLANIGLTNKLQTKRKGQSVDLVDLLITTTYAFQPLIVDNQKKGGLLGDLLFDLKLIPYSWMHIESTATYDHKNEIFSTANYDITFDWANDWAKERTFSIGQRCTHDGSNQFLYSFQWRFTPKWKFTLLDRFEFGEDPSLKHGLSEQEYTLTRDLHCWDVSLLYNIKRGEGGLSLLNSG